MATVIAIDTSGSVYDNDLYWKIVSDIYNKEKDQPAGVTYVLWDTYSIVVSKIEVGICIKEKHGQRGTSPSTIVPVVTQLTPKPARFILITDGAVSATEVDMVDGVITKLGCSFEKVECHIIHPRPDLSVTCPFTRNTVSSVWVYTSFASREKIFEITGADLALVETIEEISLGTFMGNYDKIFQMFTVACMGKAKGNATYHTKIVLAKKRLVKEMSYCMTIKASSNINLLDETLQQGQMENALNVASQLLSSYYGEDVMLLSSKIDALINMACSGVDFTVDKFKSGLSINTAAMTKIDEHDPGLNDVEITIDVAGVQPCECPILLDEDVPVIIVLAGEPILKGVSKEMMAQIRLNPLCILQNDDLCAKIQSRLGHYIGLTSFVKVFQSDDRFDPYTRQEIHGGIPLGTHQSHIKCANETIMNMFTGGYIVGNIDLFYTIVWEFISRPNGPPYLQEITPQLNEGMIYRLRHHKSSASLSGHLNMVSTHIPLAAAVWFVIHSSMIEMEDKYRPIRIHCFQTELLYKMLALVGYTIHETARKLALFTAAVSELRMFAVRKGQSALNIEMRSLVTNHLWYEEEKSYIFLDGQPSLDICGGGKNIEHWLSKYNTLTKIEVLFLGSKINVQEKIDQIHFPETTSGLTASLEDFAANLQHEYNSYHSKWLPMAPYGQKLKICPATCRPYYNVQDNVSWKQEFMQMHRFDPDQHHGKFLSAAALFGRFVGYYKRYPASVHDFLMFCFKRQVNAYGDFKATLPEHAVKIGELTLEEFSEICSLISPVEFSERFEISTCICTRCDME